MDELERFKTSINLTEFAASRGYALDRRESSRSSAVMRHPDGDKIVIAFIKPEKGDLTAWYYFSIRDYNDNGSIIDFIQNRGGGNLGDVRKTLRHFSGSSRPRIPKTDYIPQMLPLTRDRAAAIMAYEQAAFCAAVPYLTARGLDAQLITLPRFIRRFKIEAKHGNVLFPHYDKDGLCGFEVKNKGFTGFSGGGYKGLWHSVCFSADKTLVLAESAIDAISYHALQPDETARYMSTGGKMNPNQPALIRAAMERMPKGSKVVAAFDNDPDGEKLADEVRALAPSGLEVVRPLPPVGKDWNETLKKKLGLT